MPSTPYPWIFEYFTLLGMKGIPVLSLKLLFNPRSVLCRPSFLVPSAWSSLVLWSSPTLVFSKLISPFFLLLTHFLLSLPHLCIRFPLFSPLPTVRKRPSSSSPNLSLVISLMQERINPTHPSLLSTKAWSWVSTICLFPTLNRPT